MNTFLKIVFIILGVSFISFISFDPLGYFTFSKIDTNESQISHNQVNENREIFNIKSQKEDCYGPDLRKCLVVNNQLFYDYIEGFDFNPGYSYVIEVEKNKTCNSQEINNCLQDSGIYGYTLIKILEKKQE